MKYNYNMTIVVAGGTGLVGSAIVRQLKILDKKVLSLSSKDVNLLDRHKTFAYIKKLNPTAIIDAAAKVGGIGGNNAFPVEFLSQNLQIQSNLMDAAHAAKTEKFVFLGSSCIYPRNCPQPIKEDYLLTGELEQTNSAYAIAKIAGVKLVQAYRKEFGRKWTSAMPTNLYGPGDNFDPQSSHVLPALLRKFHEAKLSGLDSVTLWGSGTPRREFLHVDDLADACYFLLQNYNEIGLVNIGCGKDVSIKELAELIIAEVGYEGQLVFDTSKPDGTPRKLMDTDKINNLGWKFKINLEYGIKKTISEIRLV